MTANYRSPATATLDMFSAYDLHTGALLWDSKQPTGGEIFKYYTVFHGLTADGKVFIGTHEHSRDTPS